MSPVLYVFRLAWPFLKEMLLGGLSLREGMKSAKKKVFLLFFISGLIILTLWLVPSFYKLSQEHLALIKSVEVTNVQRLEARIKELEGTPKEEVVAEVVPVPIKPPEPLKEVVQEIVPIKQQKPVVKKTTGTVTPTKSHKDDVEAVNERKKSYMDFFDRLDN